MASFFNQKEEVMNIQLTPYGRSKLADGELSPKYYAFYDKEIIYDGVYAAVTENQNDIVTRITTSTPKFEPITRFTSSLKQVSTINNSRESFNNTNIANASFFRFLGESSPFEQNAPAWNIRIVDVSDTLFHSGSSYVADGTIPVLSATLLLEYESNSIPGSQRRTYNLKKSEKLVLDFQEKNTLFKRDGNFEIQVFTSSSIAGGVGEIDPLSFINREERNFNQLQEQSLQPYVLATTLRGNDEDISRAFPRLDKSFVEFYLDIAVDSEITDVIIPPNSTLYRAEINRDPVDLCKVTSFGGRDG
jgi:hypothetical protein